MQNPESILLITIPFFILALILNKPYLYTIKYIKDDERIVQNIFTKVQYLQYKDHYGWFTMKKLNDVKTFEIKNVKEIKDVKKDVTTVKKQSMIKKILKNGVYIFCVILLYKISIILLNNLPQIIEFQISKLK